jgi:valyl-tRNA synthetase
MIDKTYQPSAVEGRIYAKWEEAGAFRAGRPERLNAKPYCIVIPPPNVTGSLHMGHALNNTLQDVLVRFERMRGRDVLWQPGTDHAGIATQMVVERQLMERQEPGRRALGREKFLEKVWAWKAESGGAITQQLKRLGASCDWSRERFTMDEGLSRAVRKVFVELYRAGLIYKDKRLVNWDPELGTAISDLEVQQVEVKGSFQWSRASGAPLDVAALSKVLDRNPNGHLYYFEYPIADGNDRETGEFVTVATTRPETMLGDVAVAVHPDDERYKELVGKNAILPLVGRRLLIIVDEYSDPEKGTGAVKITPAHDFNDFEVGKRHNLEQVSVLDAKASLNLASNVDFIFGVVPANSAFGNSFLATIDSGDSNRRDRTVALLKEHDYSQLAETIAQLDGVDRFVARKKIVTLLEEKGRLAKIEPHTHVVPHGDRSNAVIEPYLTEQWYVNAKKLAEPAIAAVRQGKTDFVPKNWEKTYFEWMENIQPWCISRQLWWGHQIPCWYGPRKQKSPPGIGYPLSHPETAYRIVSESESEALQEATDYYGCPIEIVADLNEAIARTEIDNKKIYIWRDKDVLDTWFSSALWPFSTLGWPDNTPELKRYYPTDALVTGFDIIFFWVARMMMMGLHFMGKVPFPTVYIHALVRDQRGAKMSKSKGNVIDPLELIDKYGADSLRFTLAAMAAQGRDIKLSTQRVEGYRNFATKLWNAARFAEINGCVRVASFDPKNVKETLNLWILGETEKTVHQVTASLEAYKFNEAANAIYRFVWSVLCDWYLEFSKPLLTGRDRKVKKETRATMAFVLDQVLKLLHPFMPFLTEELWRVTGQKGPKRKTLLALAPWPHFKARPHVRAESEIGKGLDLISALRSIRSELNVPPGARIPLTIITSGKEPRWVKLGREAIKRLAQISEIMFSKSAPKGAVQIIVRNSRAALQLGDVIDYGTERARLENEFVKIAEEIARIDEKLGNKNFVERAPEEVVEGQRERREEATDRGEELQRAIEQLKAAVAVPSPISQRPYQPRKRPTAVPRRARNAGSAKRGRVRKLWAKGASKKKVAVNKTATRKKGSAKRGRVQKPQARGASKKKVALNRKASRKKAYSVRNRRSRSADRNAR